MMTVPSSIRTSTQDVLPPYFAVFGPGVGTEPLVPQNRTCILQDGGSEAIVSQAIAGSEALAVQSPTWKTQETSPHSLTAGRGELSPSSTRAPTTRSNGLKYCQESD